MHAGDMKSLAVAYRTLCCACASCTLGMTGVTDSYVEPVLLAVYAQCLPQNSAAAEQATITRE